MLVLLQRGHEVEQVVLLCQESLIVVFPDGHVHANQIVDEAEDLQEHSEAMLAEEAQVHWAVEDGLSQSVV